MGSENLGECVVGRRRYRRVAGKAELQERLRARQNPFTQVTTHLRPVPHLPVRYDAGRVDARAQAQCDSARHMEPLRSDVRLSYPERAHGPLRSVEGVEAVRVGDDAVAIHAA